MLLLIIQPLFVSFIAFSLIVDIKCEVRRRFGNKLRWLLPPRRTGRISRIS